ncbi:unnamed protein product [Rodentolepis nana]|uniref:Protein SPT2 homolog n=1 Tax=Rodentolepis nana TaxID=102285 RepID=A0A0R3T2S7_RODNA|nr:unnamed protein product [Rodentolepis nana]
MSFKSFLELAQKNQDLNDNIVKKLSEDQKKKKELYLKERKAIEAANKTKKRVESYEPPSFSSTRVEYIPSPVVNNTALDVSNQRSEPEYVPTAIPKPNKLSSLMDALEELNGEVPFAEKRFKIKTKIPKICGSGSNTQNSQKKLESVPSNRILISKSKVESDDTASSQSGSSKRDKLPLSSSAIKVFGKPGIAIQQSISTKKSESLSVPKSVQKRLHSSSSLSHSNSSRSSLKPDLSKTAVLPSKTERHVPFPSKSNSAIKNHSSSRNLLQNKAPIRTEKCVPSSKSPNGVPVRNISSKTSSTPLVKHATSSSTKSFPSSGLRTINSIRASSSANSSNLSRPCNPSRGIAAQYGLVPTSATDSSLQIKVPHPKPQSTSKYLSLKRPVEAPKRPASTIPKNGIPQKRTISNLPRPVQPQVYRPSQPPNNQPIVRGIAAQLGVLPPSAPCGNRDFEDDSDEYESDDSFIDDSDFTSFKEYKFARNEIFKSLRFDPKKYAKVGKYDDLTSMESSYRQIEKEEKLSLRLGAQEDKEDMAWEEERRRRRMEKLKHHHKEG